VVTSDQACVTPILCALHALLERFHIHPAGAETERGRLSYCRSATTSIW